MNYIFKLFAPLTVLLSLSTACGVLLHDTNIDKAFFAAWSRSETGTTTDGNYDTSKTKPGSTPHTHSHGYLADTIRDGQDHPRTTPRIGDRKHVRQKRNSRDNNISDGHRLSLEKLFA